jgi:nucleotide-binding universal stress UspA family protein
MLNIKTILLPVDFPVASFAVIHQAAALARRFQSEIVMLHVLTPLSHAAGVPDPSHKPADWDLLSLILANAKQQNDQSLAADLNGLVIHRLLREGDPPSAILEAAALQNADLIMMPSHGFTFDQFLLGSVTAKVLHRSECPLWTGAHVDVSLEQPCAIRNVLCAVDLGPRSDQALAWAARIATGFSARLTVAHVTEGVEFFGPGGWHVDQAWKDALVSDASHRIAKLERDTGVKADVFIGSGDVPKAISHAAKQTNADLLVTACYPYGGNLRLHGYAIIRSVPVPVLNV